MNDLTRNLLGYLFDRLDEPSTYRGLVLFLTSIGIVIDPNHLELLASIGLGLSGGIGMVTKDKPKA